MNKELVKYIGRPYETYNCFDLVREFYLDHYQLNLSNYWEGTTIPSRQEISSLVVSNKGDFVFTTLPSFGDIVVIKLYGIECHIGIVLDKGKFIHSIRGAGSCIESLEKYRRMVAGYYTHRRNKP